MSLHLRSALASIVRTPVTTAANILTLAMGLACFIAAYGITAYWQSGDAYHQKAQRTFVIGQTFGDGAETRFNASSSFTIGRYLREDVPELEQVARVDSQSEVTAAAAGRKIALDVAYAEPGFLDIFDFDFAAGSPATALAGADGVILTEDAAARLFGKTPAIGKSLRTGDRDAVVSGVIRSVRQPSFMGDTSEAMLRFDAIAPWTMGPAAADTQDLWTGTDGLTLVVAPPALRAESINKQLADLVARRMPADLKATTKVVLRPIPINDLTTRRLDASLFAQSGMNVSSIVALLGLGTLILIIAGVNYVNLATAQAALRAKEIGMRKLVGAGWLQIAVLTWIEAFALTVIATAAALAILALVRPVMRSIAGVDILFFLSAGAGSLVMLGAVAVLVALLAGAYPAFVLSGVRPAAALRSGRSRSGSGLAPRILVGIQFASASFLIILVTATQLQRAHLERTSLSSLEDPILVLNDLRSTGVDPLTLKARLAQQPGILSVSMTSRAPWGAGWDQIELARGIEAGAFAPTAYVKRIDHDYFATLQLKILAGRAFETARETAPSPLISDDTSATAPIVIDEAYARRLGFAAPRGAVGQIVYVPEAVMRGFGLPARPARIIGVTQTETTRLNASDISGHIYVFVPNGRYPLVRIARERREEAMAAIARTWNQLAPDIVPDPKFFDDLFRESFAGHARIGQLFALLAGAAFAIASIGIFGIAIHAASRRRHEIAVRKILGSNVAGIAGLLLANFSVPVLIGNLAAWPLGYIAAQTYLAGFANSIALTPSLFLLSMAITLLIAWAAVIGVVARAASLRPAEALRHA